MLKVGCFSILIAIGSAAPKLEEIFAWKEVTFDWPNEAAKNEALQTGNYISGNNLPLGLEIWKDKLFITVPRWKPGVAASLNYISLNNPDHSDRLVPYPDWKTNTLPKGDEQLEENHIVSTFRIKADICDRLWVMDTGQINILDDLKQISPPAIVIFDLNTNKLIRRYTLKQDDIKANASVLANIVVDVAKDKCDEAFAYIPDLGGYAVIVYSFSDNDSWRVTHNFFSYDPLKGNLTVGGVNFQWNDGVFGLALGPTNGNGFRTMYFHALVSNEEYSVNTRVLKNKTLALDSNSYGLYKHEGNKGEDSQTAVSVFDEKSNVLFLAQVLKDGITCWNPRRKLKECNLPLLVQDREKLVFINDMKIDTDRNLWILSDKMPSFLFGTQNPTEINYRIFKIPVDEAIKGTACST